MREDLISEDECRRADAAIAVLNEFSDLPVHQVGFMHLVWDLEEDDNDR